MSHPPESGQGATEGVRRPLDASERGYRLLYDETPTMCFVVDASGRVCSTNRYGAEQLGYTPDELAGVPVSRLHLAEDAGLVHDLLARCLSEPDRTHRWEIGKVHRDGPVVWVRERARVLRAEDGERLVLTVCEDTGESRQSYPELSYQATHDPLTALVNRREFERRLRRVLDTARTDNVEHALCYLDLDRFKIINDTCGHGAGDELLRQLSTVMLQRVRKRDTLARLGGDEFGALIEHCSLEQARRVANELARGVGEFRFLWEDKVFGVGASIGLVAIDASSEGVDEVMTAADRACYVAKGQGRNRIHVFRRDEAEVRHRRGLRQWADRLGHALEQERFRLWYQPIRPLGADAPAGTCCELLLRLRDERGADILPGAFLPAAERHGLASRVDRWVVDTALTWLEGCASRVSAPTLCAINLSGRSLADEGFLGYLLERLGTTGGAADRVCFEISETAAIANLSRASRFMAKLRSRGVRFALDDFGSGLSSFAYLKSLPVDFIKVDGVFVKDIVANPVDRAMVKSISDIGHVMGKQTMAEFVENDAILAQIRELGVDFAQGYAIGRPRPMGGPGAESAQLSIAGGCSGFPSATD